MIEFDVFPGGKRKVVTFSYDDGHAKDERLIALFNQYGVKGTFHLNGKKSDSQYNLDRIREFYAGHEIACHTVNHGWLNRMPSQCMLQETAENRCFLEQIVGQPVVGMSYPCSKFAYNNTVKEAMRMCGIVYSRTTDATMNFHLPNDFLEWNPTCHHRNAPELVDNFMANLNSYWTGPLFYIWGHSSEFKTEEDWAMLERVLIKLSDTDRIWYATGFEIWQYITAQRSLIISMDETCFYNPTTVPVWVTKDKTEVIYIPAGGRVRV